MNLALVGFILIVVLMYVLIADKMAPPVAFVIFPLLASLAIGADAEAISGFVKSGLGTILNTAVLFMFSISYFTMMSEQGLFDPIVNFVLDKVGKNITAIFVAVLVVTFVGHLDGSGASTFLIAIPAFKPIMDRLGVRPTIFLGTVVAMMATMNLVPWGGPTVRAATVAEIEVYDLFRHVLPQIGVMILIAVGIAVFYSKLEQNRMAKDADAVKLEDIDLAIDHEMKTSKGLFYYNLAVTLLMIFALFKDIGLPMHLIFMIAFALTVPVNFPSQKEQNKHIKEYGINAINMTITLFSVGIFMGVVKESGMIDAMAQTIIHALPTAVAPHMHIFFALFAVPFMMVLGTDAYYYAVLPVVIGIVQPFGIDPHIVAVTFLITGTYGTYLSPTVAANYVGLGLAETTIGEHIKQNLPVMWIASIVSLVAAILIGVVKF